MASENVEIEKCKIHETPMTPHYGDFDQNTQTAEIVGWVCQQCLDEEEVRKEYYEHQEGPEAANYVAEKVEEIKGIKGFQPIGGMNLLKNLSSYLSLSDASPSPIYAMAQHIISSNLCNAKSGNSKGQILANLGFIYIAGSGANKSPLIDMGIDRFMSTAFKDFQHYSSLTGKGVRKDISKLSKDKKHNLMITWDEAQELTQQVKSEALKDSYSVLSQILDNRLRPYTSVRGGHETYPPIFGSVWISGVPDFLQGADKNFWFQGFGLRNLFPKYEVAEIKDLKREQVPDDYYEKVDRLLMLLRNIEYVDFTDEFFTEYNHYRREILEDINKIQANITETQNPENFPILSKVKYPVLVWKLSMVHAASRGNFDDKLLVMEIEDLRKAQKDLEQYHKNMLEIFEAWSELNAKQAEIKSSNSLIYKFKRHFNTLTKNGKGYILTKSEPDKDGNIEWTATKSEEGEWVPDQALQRNAKLQAMDYRNAIETLLGQLYIGKKEASIVSEKGIKRMYTFYQWIN